MEPIYGSRIQSIKPCPYCGATKVLLANPFVNREQISIHLFVSLFVFCEKCDARGPVAKASVGNEDDDFVTNLHNAKREAIDSWNCLGRE